MSRRRSGRTCRPGSRGSSSRRGPRRTRRTRQTGTCLKPCRTRPRSSAEAACAWRSTTRRNASSRRSSSRAVAAGTGMRPPRSSACKRRSPAPKGCLQTSASCRTRPRTSSRPSARSWNATAVSSTLSPTSWIESLSPWPDEFGLDSMRALLDDLGEPQRAYPSIHVVGTNGKGTATRTIEELLAGETLRVGGGEAHFERAVERVRPHAEGATQFEVLTAAALTEFREQQVDVAVVEAGLRGGCDATNLPEPPRLLL